MSGRKFIQGLAFGLALNTGQSLAADAAQFQDEIVLRDGSRIMGTVTDSRDGVVTVDTSFAGTISISLEQIDTLQTHESVTVLLADDTVIREETLQIDEEQLMVAAAGVPDQTYPLSELAVVNPEPWELGEGYKWTGL